MSIEKFPVAIHEAGHVAVGLATQIAEQVVEVRIYFDEAEDHWRGQTRYDKKKPGRLTRNEGVQRFASDLGGRSLNSGFVPIRFPPTFGS